MTPVAGRGRGPAARCASCHKPIVFRREVGWVDADPHGSFDMCDCDPYANHWPAA